MKFLMAVAGLAAAVAIAGAGPAAASTLRVPQGSAVVASAWSHLSHQMSRVRPAFADHRGSTVKDGVVSPRPQDAATGACSGCDRPSSSMPESATMILLGTVLLGTSFAARRLGKAHP